MQLTPQQLIEKCLTLSPEELAAVSHLITLLSSKGLHSSSVVHHISPYLTVEEAATYCRVAVQTIYNHRKEIERMPGLGKKLLFRREALDRWLETRRKRR
jgi:excisionase family DNA binding protein